MRHERGRGGGETEGKHESDAGALDGLNGDTCTSFRFDLLWSETGNLARALISMLQCAPQRSANCPGMMHDSIAKVY